MKYRCFTRTFWRPNPSWPNDREPGFGKKHHLAYADNEEEARRICREYNESHDPGPMSRKAEYEAA